MPYQAGKYLHGERASKLGHLEVLKSPLVKELVKNFEEPSEIELNIPVNWESFPSNGEQLDIIFSVDGSIQTIEDKTPPYKALAFVKTALMKLDQVGLGRIDKITPHPFALRDLMTDAALYHATVFPLRHVKVPGLTVYDAVRQTIFESVKDSSLNGEPMETLKWLAYEKWSGEKKKLEEFQCPHADCGSKHATLLYDAEEGACPNCGNKLYITDMLGFHLDMAENAASDSVGTAYMNIHETLLLFTGIRFYWNNNKETLKRCLFFKDGPLQIRAQYSKLVAPIRRFLAHAYRIGVPINVVGQEKTGYFVEHLDLIGRNANASQLFVPDHKYICEQIQHRSASGDSYGIDTNYGAKIFLILDERHHFVLSVPIINGNRKDMDDFIQNPQIDMLIGLPNILATLPTILSNRHENALLPIELANSIASLSTYPSAQVLKLFAEANIKK